MYILLLTYTNIILKSIISLKYKKMKFSNNNTLSKYYIYIKLINLQDIKKIN